MGTGVGKQEPGAQAAHGHLHLVIPAAPELPGLLLLLLLPPASTAPRCLARPWLQALVSPKPRAR